MSEDWLHRFEETLEQLERSANEEGTSFERLLSVAESSLKCLAVAPQSTLWLVRPNLVECLSGGDIDVEAKQRIQDADHKETGFIVAEDGAEELMAVRAVADQMSCVLMVSFHETVAPRSSFIDGTSAVLDILCGFVSRHLLSQYETRFQNQVTMVELVSRLHQSCTFREASSVIVQDGASVLGDCRLSVISCQSNTNRVVAITGVSAPKAESETLQALTRLSANVEIATSEEWQNLTKDIEPPEETALSVLRQNGIQAIRFLPLRVDGTKTSSPAEAFLSIELFDSNAAPEEANVQQLRNTAAPVLVKLQRREQPLVSRMVSSRRLRLLLLTLLTACILAFVPATFEVEAPGQINSTDRRRLFAPEHGTIDTVLFENEADVKEGDVLLRMSNPDLDLEQRRLEGEIATTATQLTSVQTRRLTGDATLSGEDKQLQHQLQNLKQQLSLVEKQIATLTVKAPFSGTAFRRDAQRDLMARPVQRGQLLLEVVPTDSQWQLELRIPDRLRSYVVKYRDSVGESPEIRYLVVSTPEQDWTTALTSVDNAIQIEDGQMVCRAAAQLTELPFVDLRPGTSVVARIYCGRRSLGFVMFREVVEFWHHLKFAWL